MNVNVYTPITHTFDSVVKWGSGVFYWSMPSAINAEYSWDGALTWNSGDSISLFDYITISISYISHLHKIKITLLSK